MLKAGRKRHFCFYATPQELGLITVEPQSTVLQRQHLFQSKPPPNPLNALIIQLIYQSELGRKNGLSPLNATCFVFSIYFHIPLHCNILVIILQEYIFLFVNEYSKGKKKISILVQYFSA